MSANIWSTSKGSDSCLKLGMTLGIICRKRSCHARLPAFTLLSPLSLHTFPWRLTHFVSSKMNVSLNHLWLLSELQLYYRFQFCGDSSNGNYRGICCITEQICSDIHVYTTFSRHEQEYINSLLRRSVYLLVLNYFFFLSIDHHILIFTVSPPLSFHTAVFMNNICHIALLSLKMTLVNY